MIGAAHREVRAPVEERCDPHLRWMGDVKRVDGIEVYCVNGEYSRIENEPRLDGADGEENL